MTTNNIFVINLSLSVVFSLFVMVLLLFLAGLSPSVVDLSDFVVIYCNFISLFSHFFVSLWWVSVFKLRPSRPVGQSVHY